MGDLRNINMLDADLKAAYCRVDLDVVYTQRQAERLSLHIIRPVSKDENQKFPLIVFSQGSSWMKQDMGKEMTQLARFVEKGYVIALAEYRSVETAAFPAQIIDTKTAVYFMTQEAEKYHVDVNNIILWGTSSGGHTVVMAAVTKDLQEYSAEDLARYPLNLRCVIDYYGPSDITRIVEEKDAYKYAGQPSPLSLLIGNANLWHSPMITDKTIPMKYITAAQPTVPILIMHGTDDVMVPYRQSVELFNCLKEHGQDAELYLLRGANHGGGCFWTSEVLSIVDRFIRRHLVLDNIAE